ncbi:MAG TPA: hypothetical protein VFY37_12065 [Solirubrobacterales bacterium]|nr:hypothetical protein [Solirubrobacterales bacterium]
MSILAAIRDRFSTRDSSGLLFDDAQDAQGAPVAEAPLPFAGYDRLDDRQVVEGLSDHSQIELEAVESFERSHENRVPVLNKLRYMRQREPLPGYDALNVEEILTALEDADLATIKKVRGYERKFANRPDVLEEVARVYHRPQATQPASAAPAYRPMSAAPASNGPIDRRDKSDRP